MRDPTDRDLTVRAADGWRLSVQWRVPAGTSKGCALLLHAMMVDRRSMDRPAGEGLASTLVAQGWTVALADFRGHGASGPAAEAGGSWTYDDLVYRDVPALVAACRRLQDGPVVVVGHSLGGHVTVASAACGAAHPDAVVCLAANVWLPALEPDDGIAWAKHLATQALRGTAAVVGRFPSRAMGVGPADEARPYIQDLARYGLTSRWMSRDGRHDWMAQTARIEVPVLSVLGGGDILLARPAQAAAWVMHVPQAEVWVVGSGAYGVEGQPGHMDVVTDSRCAPMWQHVADWMAAATTGVPAARPAA